MLGGTVGRRQQVRLTCQQRRFSGGIFLTMCALMLACPVQASATTAALLVHVSLSSAEAASLSHPHNDIDVPSVTALLMLQYWSWQCILESSAVSSLRVLH